MWSPPVSRPRFGRARRDLRQVVARIQPPTAVAADQLQLNQPGTLRAFPWPHLLIDDLLPFETLTQCLVEIGSDSYEFEIEPRGTGQIEFSLLKSKTLWRAIYSKKMISVLRFAFGASVSLNKHNMVQLRRMSPETPDFPLHNDFVYGSETIASFLIFKSGLVDAMWRLFSFVPIEGAVYSGSLY
jgi:hypothetical protein